MSQSPARPQQPSTRRSPIGTPGSASSSKQVTARLSPAATSKVGGTRSPSPHHGATGTSSRDIPLYLIPRGEVNGRPLPIDMDAHAHGRAVGQESGSQLAATPAPGLTKSQIMQQWQRWTPDDLKGLAALSSWAKAFKRGLQETLPDTRRADKQQASSVVWAVPQAISADKVYAFPRQVSRCVPNLSLVMHNPALHAFRCRTY